MSNLRGNDREEVPGILTVLLPESNSLGEKLDISDNLRPEQITNAPGNQL